MWGPAVRSVSITEAYADSPGGTRLVRYFDKSRMEINDPTADPTSTWYVTNGLLARDLILGQVQIGDDDFFYVDSPEINIAGDLDEPGGPTYRTFHGVIGSDALPVGTVIVQTIDRDGSLGTDDSLATHGVTAAHFEPQTGHTVASVFWQLLHSEGLVYRDGAFVEDRLFEHLYYPAGYPLTEAFWTTVRVGGVPTKVLVQVFERRVLTYTPDNSEGWQIESGNAGLHYYHWLYEVFPGNSSDPNHRRAAGRLRRRVLRLTRHRRQRRLSRRRHRQRSEAKRPASTRSNVSS
jgi:hypothetical protein